MLLSLSGAVNVSLLLLLKVAVAEPEKLPLEERDSDLLNEGVAEPERLSLAEAVLDSLLLLLKAGVTELEELALGERESDPL